MESTAVQGGKGLRWGGGPLVFRGTPPACVGDLFFANDSDEQVKVRSIGVAGLGDGAATISTKKLSVGLAIPASGSMRSRAYLRVDPHTPPGTYDAELAWGDQRAPATVYVWEKASLRIDPSVVRLRGGAGDTVRFNIGVTNEGNVAETVRDLALVFLEERDWIGRSMVEAMRHLPRGDGHQAYLDGLVRELKATMAPPAQIVVKPAEQELGPGATLALELEVVLPAELKKGRTYFGSAKFMSRSLSFEVECNGAAHSDKRRPR